MNKLLSILNKIGKFTVLFFVFWHYQIFADNKVTQFENIYYFIYPEKDSVLVRKLSGRLKDPIRKMEDFFKNRPKSRINIYLTRSNEEFEEYTKNALPEWAGAVALTNINTIIIKITKAEDVERLPQITLHELAHIFTASVVRNGRLPVWLHEGIAQWLSNDELDINEQLSIANAMAGGSLVSLSDLNSLLKFNQAKAKLAYALSRSAVDFFRMKYGSDKLLKIVQEFSTSKNADKIFFDVTGKDFIDFEFAWYGWLDDKYRWLILLNLENLIWIFLVTLFILAFIRIKFKNRNKIKTWLEDDDEDYP